MPGRKKYDYHGIEITMWNRTNTVYSVRCDCGELAQSVPRTRQHFRCATCHREYKQHLGDYVLIEPKERTN